VETERVAKPGEPAVPPFVRARQQHRIVEHYWLCDDCAKQWTLVSDPGRGMALVALRRPLVSVSTSEGVEHRGVA
jgi:hypothetical protein